MRRVKGRPTAVSRLRPGSRYHLGHSVHPGPAHNRVVNAAQSWTHSTLWSRSLSLTFSTHVRRVSYGAKEHATCVYISLHGLLFIHTVRARALALYHRRRCVKCTLAHASLSSSLIRTVCAAAFRPSSCPLLNPSPLFAMHSVRQRLRLPVSSFRLFTRVLTNLAWTRTLQVSSRSTGKRKCFHFLVSPIQ